MQRIEEIGRDLSSYILLSSLEHKSLKKKRKMNIKNCKWLALALVVCFASCDPEEQVTDITQFPRIKIENQTVNENSGSTEIFVELTWAYGETVTVDYKAEILEGGQAKPNVDFIGSEGTLTFEPGELINALPIEVVDDIISESDEKFQITLSNPVLGKLLNTQAIITILDEDENVVIDGSGYDAPTIYQGYQRIWEDEFDGDEIDSDVWCYDIGGHGWGNNELQHYTDRGTNSFQTQGYMFIEAREEKFGENDYTSARLLSRDKMEFKYGRVDIRAKLPKGKGIWPALWMLGGNFDEIGWPRCGEIDIMELIGSQPNVVHGTVHFYGSSNTNESDGKSTFLTGGEEFSDEFHVFSVVWNEDYIEWRLDGVRFHSIVPDDLNGGDWPFNEEFFLIMNVAVGGNWPGSPNASTVFPQQMLIDYVRLYQLV